MLNYIDTHHTEVVSVALAVAGAAWLYIFYVAHKLVGALFKR